MVSAPVPTELQQKVVVPEPTVTVPEKVVMPEPMLIAVFLH
jgi:hypothetical protein